MRIPRHRTVLLLTLFCLTPLIASAQHLKSRAVEKSDPEGPVEVTGLEIDGQPGLVNGPVVAGKDWLRSLRLDIKNNHDREIVYMTVELEIAPAGKIAPAAAAHQVREAAGRRERYERPEGG